MLLKFELIFFCYLDIKCDDDENDLMYTLFLAETMVWLLIKLDAMLMMDRDLRIKLPCFYSKCQENYAENYWKSNIKSLRNNTGDSYCLVADKAGCYTYDGSGSSYKKGWKWKLRDCGWTMWMKVLKNENSSFQNLASFLFEMSRELRRELLKTIQRTICCHCNTRNTSLDNDDCWLILNSSLED